jgi:hypothetical protein
LQAFKEESPNVYERCFRRAGQEKTRKWEMDSEKGRKKHPKWEKVLKKEVK